MLLFAVSTLAGVSSQYQYTYKGAEAPLAQSSKNPVCCNVINKGSRIANTNQAFNTPVQVQTYGADNLYWTSALVSIIPNQVIPATGTPFVIGTPFPDPTGIQARNVLQQTAAEFAAIGLRRDDIILMHITQ